MGFKDVFQKNGFVLSQQATKLLSNMKDADVHATKILEQARLRKFQIAAGDVIHYQLTGKICPTIKGTEDL